MSPPKASRPESENGLGRLVFVSRIRHTLIMRKRIYLAPVESERCAAHAATAVKGEGSRCMRRAVIHGLCKQHRTMTLEPEAGHVAEAVYPASGSRIVVYVASEQGIDCGARYAVVCSAHATILGESSLRSARRTMRHPEFCEACIGASLPHPG